MMPLKTESEPEWERLGPYRVHPVASLFPLMEDEEFDALKDSIKYHRQQLPILVMGDVLLDGRNRLRACLELKREPWVEQYSGSQQPGEVIYALNLERRHLPEDQWTALSFEACRLIKAEAKERQRQAGVHGQEGGRGNKKTLPLNSSEGFPKSKKAPDTRKQLAEKAGVSEHKAQQAMNVQRDAPELFEKVKQGKMPLREAAKQAKQKKRQPPQWSFEKACKVVARLMAKCPSDERERFKTYLRESI